MLEWVTVTCRRREMTFFGFLGSAPESRAVNAVIEVRGGSIIRPSGPLLWRVLRILDPGAQAEMTSNAYAENYARDETATEDHQNQIEARSVARQLSAQQEKASFLAARSAASQADDSSAKPTPQMKAGAKPKSKPAIPAFMQRKRTADAEGASATQETVRAAAPAPAAAANDAKRAKPAAQPPAPAVSLVAYGESSSDEDADAGADPGK